jgi:hypothetical protein
MYCEGRMHAIESSKASPKHLDFLKAKNSIGKGKVQKRVMSGCHVSDDIRYGC